MKLRRIIAALAALTMIATAAGCGSSETPSASSSTAQSASTTDTAGDAQWPDSIQLIVASTAGGFADVHARLVANYLQQETGIAVAVVNQAEGGGIVAYDTVKNAPTDGSTLLFYHSNFIIACETGVYDADPIDDFTVVAAMENGGSQVIVVSADSPYETLDDLVNAALENPGQVSFGMQTGGASHFIGALLGEDKGAEFDLVEAGNQTEKITSMLGGYIDACNIAPAAALQYVEAGDMRILCSISGEADPFFPEIPTAAELGYPAAAYDSDFWLMGPAGMDPALVELINSAFKNMENDESMIDALATQGSHYTWADPQESQVRLEQDVLVHRAVAQELGF